MTELILLRVERKAMSLNQCVLPVALQLDCYRESLVLVNAQRYSKVHKEVRL